MLLRRVPHLALLTCCFALAWAGMSSASALAAPDVLALTAPVTDNYKARWNADPSIRELRSWQSSDAYVAAGTTWRPVAPASIVIAAGPIAVQGADGRTAQLAARVVQGAATVLLRFDPTARGAKVGPLVSLTNPETIAATPVRVELTLRVDAAVLAAGIVEYRPEPAFAAVGAEHLEHNGPAGRWHAGGTALRTDWEPAPAAPIVVGAAVPTTPPRITQLIAPTRVTRPFVTIAVRGSAVGSAKITHARVQIGAGRWSAWTPIRASYTLRLRRVRGTHRIRVQLRNANGQASSVVQRFVRCTCS